MAQLGKYRQAWRRHRPHGVPQNDRLLQTEPRDDPSQILRLDGGAIALFGCGRAPMAAGINHDDVILRRKRLGDGRPAQAIIADAMGKHERWLGTTCPYVV